MCMPRVRTAGVYRGYVPRVGTEGMYRVYSVCVMGVYCGCVARSVPRTCTVGVPLVCTAGAYHGSVPTVCTVCYRGCVPWVRTVDAYRGVYRERVPRACTAGVYRERASLIYRRVAPVICPLPRHVTVTCGRHSGAQSPTSIGIIRPCSLVGPIYTLGLLSGGGRDGSKGAQAGKGQPQMDAEGLQKGLLKNGVCSILTYKLYLLSMQRNTSFPFHYSICIVQ